MRTAKEIFDEELSGEPLTNYSVEEVIKMVQKETIDEVIKECLKEAVVEVVDHKEYNIEDLPAYNGVNTILPIYGVDEDSIIKVGDKLKKQLDELS